MTETFGEMLDTSLEARRRYYTLLRTLTPEQRARKVGGLCRTARALALAGIRQARPDAGPAELRRLLAARLYGEEIAARYFSADHAVRT